MTSAASGIPESVAKGGAAIQLGSRVIHTRAGFLAGIHAAQSQTFLALLEFIIPARFTAFSQSL
jgi:hypothetical protein